MRVLTTTERVLADATDRLPGIGLTAKESLPKTLPALAVCLGSLHFLLSASMIALLVTDEGASQLGFQTVLLYGGMLLLLMSGIAMLAAYTPLKRRKLSGWRLFLVGLQVGLLQGLIALLLEGANPIRTLLTLSSYVFAVYLVFQIRDKYKA